MSISQKIELQGEAKYKASLQSIVQKNKELAAEMKAVSSGADSQEKKLEVLNKQISNQQKYIDKLNEGYEKQKSKVDETRKALEKAVEKYGQNSAEAQKLADALVKEETALSKQKTAVNNAVGAMNKLEKELDGVSEASEEEAKAAEDAERATSHFGDTLKALFVNDIIRNGVSFIANSMKQIASAAVDFVGDVVEGYGQYEQLVGGVEKLYGQNAVNVINKAAEAYKSAGMNANTYLDTVTSFSASLISSVGGDTVKAAELADQAIRDMADNANVFGSSMEDVVQVYKSLSKEQYTTLDNLKLGYAGTKEGMKALIDDANKLRKINGEMGNLSIENYSDVIEAIHIIQTEMNITGTTQKEAAQTIEGSINSTKAAWDNLVVGFGDADADIQKLVQDVIDGATDVVNNVIPIIENVVKALPQAVSSLTQTLRNSGIIKNMVQVAKDIARDLIKELPGIMSDLFSVIADLLADLDIDALINAVFKLINKIINDIVPKIPTLIGTLVIAIVKALPNLFVQVGNTIQNLFGAIFEGFDIGTERRAFTELADSISDDCQALVDSFELVQEAKKKQIENANEEASYYEGLLIELKKITDENGRVRDGYEARAKFIQGELNSAYNTEIQIIDGVVQEYGALIESIQGAIDKERAMTILAAEKEAYTQAINTQADAYEKMIAAQQALEASYPLLEAEMDSAWAAQQREYGVSEDMIETRAKERLGITELEDSYNSMADTYQQCLSDIARYETDYALASEGKYDQIGKTVISKLGNSSTALKQYSADLSNAIASDSRELDSWNAIYEKALADGDQAYADTVKTHIDSLTEAINANKEALDENESNIQQFNDDVIARMESDGVVMASNAYNSGVNYGQGLVNGMNSYSSIIYNAGALLALQAKNGFNDEMEIKSPSRVMMESGEYVGEGTIIGMRNKFDELRDVSIEMAGIVHGEMVNRADSVVQPVNNNTTTHNAIELNVYGAEGQDVNQLADTVIDRLQQVIGRESAVYA